MSRILSTLQRQLLPLGLIAAAVVGILLPRPGQFMAQLPTQYVAVATIFVCSGLLLRTQDLRAALSGWPAAVWGCLAILFITPAIGVPLALLVPVEESFRLGLALFCCMPTTLSSGIALTAQARGNVALALLLTVLSNALGILTVPFVLAHLLGFLGEIELSAGDLLAKLCLVILVPLSLGCYLRRFAEEWIAGHRSTITTVSNLALISVPAEPFCWIGTEVKRRSPFTHTLFSGYSNGSWSYIPTAEAFAEGGYEVGVSLFSPQAAVTLVDEAVALLEQMGK